VVQLGALLHDISDHKYGGSNEQAQAAIKVSAAAARVWCRVAQYQLSYSAV
jgi:hypothetical protein